MRSILYLYPRKKSTFSYKVKGDVDAAQLLDIIARARLYGGLVYLDDPKGWTSVVLVMQRKHVVDSLLPFEHPYGDRTFHSVILRVRTPAATAAEEAAAKAAAAAVAAAKAAAVAASKATVGLPAPQPLLVTGVIYENDIEFEQEALQGVWTEDLQGLLIDVASDAGLPGLEAELFGCVKVTLVIDAASGRVHSYNAAIEERELYDELAECSEDGLHDALAAHVPGFEFQKLDDEILQELRSERI